MVFECSTDKIDGFGMGLSSASTTDSCSDSFDDGDSYHEHPLPAREDFARGGSADQLPHPPKPCNSDIHPKFHPMSVKCTYCKKRGHSLHNCFTRMKHHHRMMSQNCVNGWHKPHLHDQIDLWRCEWCLSHLKSSYVKEFYPEHWKYEPSKVIDQRAVNLAKYSDIPPFSEA